MSQNDQEYQRFMGLLRGDQVSTVSSTVIHACLAARVCSQLGQQTRYRFVHDGCDIRKPDSNTMEYLGTDAMTLDHKPVSGYKTMNSILIDADRQGVSLVATTLYSNKVPNFLKEEALKSPETLTEAQKTLVDAKTYINHKAAFFQNVKQCNDLLKSQHPSAQGLHIADRGHDDASTFAYIHTEIKDFFIIRSKDNRLSHLTFPAFTPTGKRSKNDGHYKLIDKKMAHGGEYDIALMTIKGKKYTNLTAKIDWESLIIDGHTYSVVRCALYSHQGVALFKQPMLLLTNCPITCIDDAKEIYLNYLLRSKIEVVFRFLKQYLGWETFQIRDFNAIQNLLAIAFFLVGYCHELNNALIEDPLILKLCALAHSKGVVSTHFILKGLAIIAAAQLVEQWKRELNISQQDIDHLLTLFSP